MSTHNLTGRVFGRLTVTGKKIHIGKYVLWECVCSCSNIVNLRNCKLVTGHTTSCGCLHKEIAAISVAKIAYRHGHCIGGHRTPIYSSWAGMIDRCTKPNFKNYKYWGGRGIKVCPEWLAFKNFIKDMGPTWEKGLTLDRINNDSNYTPDNCRWATAKQQANNRRNNVR
jgi:hypothetical protein